MHRKPPFALRAVVFAVAASLVLDPIAFAQQPPPAAAAAPATAAAPGAKTFTQKDLDELMAPVALYPDALLSQVLMASTYPLEVVEAARWQKANPSLKDKALEAELEKQTWDPSVKALAAVPQVLTMMNEKLDWTTKLGDAFLAQQEDVLKTAQSLRVKADAAGNLKTSEQLTVKKETENNVQVIKIESPKPETVYVPTYNPATVYGPWWYAAPPPYYYYPPGYVYGGAGLAFASGVFWGAAIAGGIGWGNNEININRNTNINTGDRNNIQGGNRNQGGNKWQHNPEHRKGAAYRDSGTAQKYNRGGDTQRAQSRDQYRGRADQGRQDMSSMDRGELNRAADRGGAGDRGGGGGRDGAQASNRSGGGDFGGGNRGGSGGASASTRGGGSSGFSGAGGGGASTRAASSRGSSSMSRGGGGGGRGGGGRR